ncbi:MAG: SPASM domain-containing protein [Parcubacteria group bacterium]|nr:SPASM domain-containing protein [Parcubacteria group bacterium]
MDAQTATLDIVRIDNRHLVLISENRISFIPNVSDEEIEQACVEERRVIVAHANASTTHTQLGPSIAFMPTFDCNLRCIYCYAKGGEDQTSLPLATAKHTIDWTASKTDDPHAKPLTVYFVGGGEPFMNFRMMDGICRYSRERFASVEVVVVSNGIHGQKQRQWLIENKASTRISFDGIMHAKNRPLATHAPSDAIVEQTIKELAVAGVPLTVQLTITRDGTAHMFESIERISSLGARYIKIEPVHHSVLSRGEQSLVPDLEEFVEMFLSSLKRITEQGLLIKIDNSFISRPTSGYYCGAGEGSNVTVTPTGLITSCLEVASMSDAYADTMIYGRCTESGQVVIDDDKRRFLDRLHWRNYPNCPGCNLKLICGGGCPMQGGWDNNDLLNPSAYTCRAHQMLLPKIFAQVFDDPRTVDVVFDNHTIERQC